MPELGRIDPRDLARSTLWSKIYQDNSPRKEQQYCSSLSLFAVSPCECWPSYLSSKWSSSPWIKAEITALPGNYCSASSHSFFFLLQQEKIFQLLAYCTADYPHCAPERSCIVGFGSCWIWMLLHYFFIVFSYSNWMFEFLEANRRCLLSPPFGVPFPGGALAVPFMCQLCVERVVLSLFVVVVALLPRLQEQGSLLHRCRGCAGSTTRQGQLCICSSWVFNLASALGER